jgi:hypothetical protein
MLLLVMFTTNTISGSEKQPEIADNENDIISPFRYIRSSLIFKHIDIVSSWIFEDHENPEYLFISIKINDLKFSSFFTTSYSVCWHFKGIDYVAIVQTQFRGNYIYASINTQQGKILSKINVSFDIRQNIVTLKIYKNYVGSPRLGDTLIHIYAKTTISLWGRDNILIAKDIAPNNVYGHNYNINF